MSQPAQHLCRPHSPAILAGDVGPAEDIEGLSNAALAERIIAAPDRAQPHEAALFRRFSRRVYLYGMRHLRSEHDANDLVQRVMTLTLEKLRGGQVREPARIDSFILGTARMVAREIRRDGQRATPAGAVPDVADLRARPPEPLAGEHLARCLESLAERDRAVVVMTYYGEQSTADIATALRLKEANVRVIRHRSIAQLRDCMGLAT